MRCGGSLVKIHRNLIAFVSRGPGPTFTFHLLLVFKIQPLSSRTLPHAPVRAPNLGSVTKCPSYLKSRACDVMGRLLPHEQPINTTLNPAAIHLSWACPTYSSHMPTTGKRFSSRSTINCLLTRFILLSLDNLASLILQLLWCHAGRYTLPFLAPLNLCLR